MTPLKLPSNNSIDRAAETLLSSVSGVERERAQNLVNDWRASFNFPLKFVFSQMRNSTRVQRGVICSRRLKRMESIIAKLQRPEMRQMKLSRMQDIGGCRAIFPDLKSLNSFRKSREIQIKNMASYIDSSDYINSPKQDGYRGVHLIVHPRFKNPKYTPFNARRIEIQIRTQLQHTWATTVESVDMFYGQSLKIGGGDSKWRRFFALCSTVFALEERTPIVPGTPGNKERVAAEILRLTRELDPFRIMEGWKAALRGIDQIGNRPGHTTAVVTVDLAKMSVSLNTFSNDEIEKANALYASTEEEIRGGREAHTFLVALDRMRDLKAAYPNLYADTEAFSEKIMDFLRFNININEY